VQVNAPTDRTGAVGLAPSTFARNCTRRDFIGGAVVGVSAAWRLSSEASAGNVSAPRTSVLINEASLRKKYPKEISELLDAVRSFVERYNGDVIDVGRETTARKIKARLVQHPRPPRRLVIFGDESEIPRFRIKDRDLDLEIDYFYGDLDADGLAEVAISRVLGEPRTMIRQLGVSRPAAAAPRAVLFGGYPQLHLENNRLVSLLGDRGCGAEIRESRDLETLAKSDLIILAGHGDPNGWYGATIGPSAYVTATTVPELPLHPVIFAGACSTTTPGAPILRAFLEKGCRVYVGAASVAFGWTPGDLANELNMHMFDAIRERPDWTVAEVIGEARNRYVRVNQLGSTLLRLEKGESFDFDHVRVATALQFEVFGDITATFPRARPRLPFTPRALVPDRTTFKPGASVPVRFNVGPADGVPTLYLRADWDREVCAGLEMEIKQNGRLIHTIDWKRQREWYEYVDVTVGGYPDGDRYHAYAVVPLFRKVGTNTATVVLKQSAKPVQLLSESVLQVWPKRRPPHACPKQLSRREGTNLLLLSDNNGLDPLRRALTSIDRLQVDFHDSLGDPLDPYEFPDEPEQFLDLARYDAILVDALPRGSHGFPHGMMERFRDFTRQGGGLAMLGSRRTFGGTKGDGSFVDTPLEEALPVQIGMRERVFAAESVFLGRLGGYRNSGANLTRAEQHLEWARHQTAERIVDDLIEKYIDQFNRQSKRGATHAQRFYGEASARFASYGIDLDDTGANDRVMESHVAWAKKQSSDTLRQEIAKKVRVLLSGAAQGMFVEEKTAVSLVKSHAIVSGLEWSRFPEIAGYNCVTAKPQAEVIAQTQSGDPILIVWQYGHGRSAAFTTSFGRTWNAGFNKWPHYARFWSNLIRWLGRADEQ
jgi:uncharacterized membrane protein